MSHPTDPADHPTESTNGTPSAAEDLLPPIQPPAASFIMQLFFIPLLIVSGIVGVWMLFSWIANLGSQPTELVDDIEQLNHASWQKALTLANTLRDPRYKHLREDAALAGSVGTLLGKQLDLGLVDRDHVWLQIYLCRVLGEFNIDDGLPVLIQAAAQAGPPENIEVRRSALQAISLLIDRIGAPLALENDQLLPALKTIGQTPDTHSNGAAISVSPAAPQRLRSTAAYVLGLLDSPAARDQLVQMLGDVNVDVRFNATIGLARLGDARSEPGLIEMLQPTEESLLAGIDQTVIESEVQQWLTWRRDLIVSNALKAAQILLNTGEPSACRQLRETIAAVADDELASDSIRAEAAAMAALNAVTPVTN